MPEDNAERVRDAIEALNRGSIERLLEMCEPDVEWIAIPGFLPDAEDFHGRAGVRAWFEKIAEAFGEVEWEVAEAVGTGERMLLALRLRAAGRASGVAGELRIFQSLTLRDGKLARLETYLTRAEAAASAGLAE
jgi:ketosteroid isomerase-like protein